MKAPSTTNQPNPPTMVCTKTGAMAEPRSRFSTSTKQSIAKARCVYVRRKKSARTASPADATDPDRVPADSIRFSLCGGHCSQQPSTPAGTSQSSDVCKNLRQIQENCRYFYAGSTYSSGFRTEGELLLKSSPQFRDDFGHRLFMRI